MQLGLLDKAIFKAAKSLTAWEKLQQTGGIAQDLPRMLVVFLENTLERKQRLFLMKISQWCVFNRMEDAATQRLDWDQKPPNWS